MKIFKSLSVAVLFSAIFMTGVFAEESDSESKAYKPHYPIRAVIMTSNYESPRMLAEAARKELKVPYILLPAAGSEGSIMFLPAQMGNTIELKAKDLSKFIAFLRPKTVIFLGNEKVVSPAYRSAVPVKTDTFKIEDEDWEINALMLSNFFTHPKILKEYKTLSEQKKAGQMPQNEKGK